MKYEAAVLGMALVFLSPLSSTQPAATQPRTIDARAHVVIPFLADATRPGDLAFEGAECEVNTSGDTMDCQFQQVFLTTADTVPDTCLVTTNRYQRTFQRQSDALWISREGPAGECGLVDVATLRDDGGVRWTMTIRKDATRRETASCRNVDEPTGTLSWQNLRRPLPCRFVQPGGLSR